MIFHGKVKDPQVSSSRNYFLAASRLLILLPFLGCQIHKLLVVSSSPTFCESLYSCELSLVACFLLKELGLV
ncbi:unnamed protein product, partial [Linum tenue]